MNATLLESSDKASHANEDNFLTKIQTAAVDLINSELEIWLCQTLTWTMVPSFSLAMSPLVSTWCMLLPIWTDIFAFVLSPRGLFPARDCAHLFACVLISFHIFRPAVGGIWATAASGERRSWPQWRVCRGAACTDVHTHSRIWDHRPIGVDQHQWLLSLSVCVCMCAFVYGCVLVRLPCLQLWEKKLN